MLVALSSQSPTKHGGHQRPRRQRKRSSCDTDSHRQIFIME